MTNTFPGKTIARLRSNIPPAEWQQLLHMLRTNWPPGGAGWWLVHQTPTVQRGVDSDELRSFCDYYRGRLRVLNRSYAIALEPPSARERLAAQHARVFLSAPFLRRVSTGDTQNVFHRVWTEDMAHAVVTTTDGDVTKAEAPRFVKRDVLRVFHVQRDYMRRIAPYVAEMPHVLTLQPLWLGRPIDDAATGVPMRIAQGRYLTAGKGFSVRCQAGWIAWCRPDFSLTFAGDDVRTHHNLLMHGRTYESARNKLARAVRAAIPIAIAHHAQKWQRSDWLDVMDAIPELRRATVKLSVPGDATYTAVLKRVRNLHNGGAPDLPGYAVCDSLNAAGVKDRFTDPLSYALYAAWLHACLFAELKTEEARAWQYSLLLRLSKVTLA
jgi:hypothetical protein